LDETKVAILKTRRPWFGPLGEFSWDLTIQLFERWQLRGMDWPKKIRRELKAEFAGVDSNALALSMQSHGLGSLTYGDTSLLACHRLLDPLPRDFRFLDLGSGRGVPTLTAAALGFRSAAGVEFVPRHVEGARRVADRLGLKCEFYCGDFEELQWPEADLIMICSTGFSVKLRERLQLLLLRLAHPPKLILTLDWILDEPFQLVRRYVCPVGWGTANFLFYELKPGDAPELGQGGAPLD
jgi:SAM-dependent methyltransferase